MIATTHPAVQYLNALFTPNDIVCLTFISSTEKYASGGFVTTNIFVPLSEVSTDAGIARLIERNKTDHIYISMTPFKAGSKNRTKDNIAGACHVFIEADENGDAVRAAVRADVAEGDIPAPTIVVQSSPHKYQFVWNVIGFTIPQQEAMNRTLQQRFGTDAQATDAARVLRIAGFRNLKPKYGDPKPVAELVEYNEPPFMGITIHDFNIPLTSEPDNTIHPAASDAVVQQSIELLEAAMDAASVSYTRKVWEGSGGAYKFILALCPWRENHENGGPSDAMAIVQPSGAYGFKCLHNHCSDKGWDEFRAHLENLAERKLPFKSNGQPKSTVEVGAHDTATVLYNTQAVVPTDDVWIAEGEPDTLVLAQAGFAAVGYPTASYKPTDTECELLSTAKRRFLAGDNDPAGVKAMDALQKRLGQNTFCIKWPNNRKDANDVLTNECGNDPAKFKALIEELKDRSTQTESLLVRRKANSITPKEIKWLWQDKIPLGKLTLYSGNPDNGKSIVSVSLAAMCSTEQVFPGCHFAHEPADVLMLVGEDDLDDTVVPRLMAARADLDRIEFPETIRPVQEQSREIRLDLDIPAIERTLAANPNIRLITIDPISNYLGNVPMSADQDVRSMILMPLKRLAEKYNVAVVIVMHLNKKSDLDAINRVGGAMAFIAVCRVAWLFTRNVQEDTPEGEDVTPNADETPDTFSMLCIKNNIAKAYHTGLSYSVQVRGVKIEGKSVLEPYVVWGNAIRGSADDALKTFKQKGNATNHVESRPSPKKQEAIDFLMESLQDGEPHPQKPLIKEAKERDNIKSDTLMAAYRELVRDGIARRAWKVTADTGYIWKLMPMHAVSEDQTAPQQSVLVSVDGAA